MSEELETVETAVTPEPKKEFKIEITLSEANVAYKSDFPESDTVFWLEWVKTIILQKTLSNLNQEAN
jgi:hypothetical protein